MSRKLSIIIGIIVVLIALIVVFMATGVLKFNVSVNNENKAEEFVLPEGWTKYTSGEFGYVVAYPEIWNAKENNGAGSREIIFTAPAAKAFVRISGFVDKSLNSPQAVEASIAEYKATLEAKDENQEVLKQFESKVQGQIGGFAASGIMAANGSIYQYLERGLLATNGRVLIMRGGVDTSVTNLTQEEFDGFVATVKKIMDSFSTN